MYSLLTFLCTCYYLSKAGDRMSFLKINKVLLYCIVTPIAGGRVSETRVFWQKHRDRCQRQERYLQATRDHWWPAYRNVLGQDSRGTQGGRCSRTWPNLGRRRGRQGLLLQEVKIWLLEVSIFHDRRTWTNLLQSFFAERIKPLVRPTITVY